jgi:hypothetical protein
MYPNTEAIAQDRRACRRYELSLRLSYWVSKGRREVASGTGIVRDISSSGLAFTCGRPLEPGSRITVSVELPVLLPAYGRRTLVATGQVVRTDAEATAIRCSQRTFRTTGKADANSSVPSHQTDRSLGPELLLYVH